MADVGTVYTRFQIREVERALQNLARIENTLNRLEGRTVQLRVDTGGMAQATTALGRLQQSAAQVGIGLQQVGTGIRTAFASISKPIINTVDLFQKGRLAALRFTDQITHMGQTMAILAYRLEVLIAPLQMFIGMVGKSVIELEHGLAIVGTQTEYSGAQLQEFFKTARKEMQDTTERWAVSQADLQRGIFHLISSMEIAPEVATKLGDVISKFAVIGETTPEKVAELEAILATVFLDPDVLTNADRIGELIGLVDTQLSQVFLAMREGRGDFAAFIAQIGDFLRLGQLVKFPLAEQLAAFTVFTKTIAPAEAATRLKRLFQSLIEEKTIEGLASLGIAVSQIAEGQENVGYWTSRSSLMTEKQVGSLASLSSELTHVQAQIDKVNQAMREWTSRTKESTKMGQREQLRVLEEQKAALEAQIAPLENLATSTEKVFIRTGEKVRRAGIDILLDLSREMKALDETVRVARLEKIFPNIRAELGAIEFIQFANDIANFADSWDETSESFKNAVKIINEQADVVNNTILGKVTRIFSTLINLGQDLETDFEPQIKGALDVVLERLRALRDLSPEVRQEIAKFALGISALPPAMLLASVAIMGIGGLANAILTLASPGILGLAGGLFLLFREELAKLRTVLAGYDLTTLEGITTFMAEFAIAAGLVDQPAVEGFFKQLQIGLDLDPSRIVKLKDALKGIGDQVQRSVDYVMSWVQAFRDFFDMVERREGLLGNLIEFFEQATGFLGRVVPTIPGIEGVGKKEVIDIAVTGFIVKQVADVLKGLWTATMWVKAGVVNVAGGLGLGGGAAAAGGAASGNIAQRFFGFLRGLPLIGGLIPTAGAAATLGAIALLLRGSTGGPPPGIVDEKELERLAELARAQGISLQTPELNRLFAQFGQPGLTVEKSAQIMGQIRGILEAAGLVDPERVAVALALDQALSDVTSSLQLFTDAIYKGADNVTTVLDKLKEKFTDREGLLTPERMAIRKQFEELGLTTRPPLARIPAPDMGAFWQGLAELGVKLPVGIPRTGRGVERNLGPLFDQFQTLLQQIITTGVKVDQPSLEALVAEFMTAGTTEERQREIVTRLTELVTGQETGFQRLVTSIEGLGNRLANSFYAIATRYGIGGRAGAIPFHTGGWIDMLRSEFITSPLTTRMLEAAIGGPLTQGGLRQLAMATVATQHSVTIGGNVGINLTASGMGDYQLTARQREDLGWEITGLVAERLRKVLSNG